MLVGRTVGLAGAVLLVLAGSLPAKAETTLIDNGMFNVFEVITQEEDDLIIENQGPAEPTTVQVVPGSVVVRDPPILSTAIVRDSSSLIVSSGPRSLNCITRPPPPLTPRTAR